MESIFIIYVYRFLPIVEKSSLWSINYVSFDATILQGTLAKSGLSSQIYIYIYILMYNLIVIGCF